MAEENKKEEVVVKKEEVVPPPVVKAEEKKEKKEEKKPDLYKLKLKDGKEVELEYDKAKLIIDHMDSRTAGYNEMKANFEVADKAREELLKKLEGMEAAKKNDMTAAEEHFTSKSKAEMKMIKDALIDKSLKAELGEMGDVLEDIYGDVVKLFKMEHQLDVEAGTLDVKTKDGKAVKEALKEWLDKRPAYKAASKSTGTTGQVRPGAVNRPGNKLADIDKKFREGIERLGKK
jgi:hypothetical protein